MGRLRLPDFGGMKSDVETGDPRPYYKKVTVNWSEPIRVRKDGPVPLEEREYRKNGYFYVLMKDHGNQSVRDKILYVGITNKLKVRFYNHPKFWEIISKNSHVYFCVGEPDFHGYRTAENYKNRQAIEEIEHIYIWTLFPYLENYQKFQSFPGMSKAGARAWMIENKGYSFSGNMPKKIVYPWAGVRF